MIHRVRHDIQKAVTLVKQGKADYIDLYTEPHNFVTISYGDEQLRQNTLLKYERYTCGNAVGYWNGAVTHYLTAEDTLTTLWYEAVVYASRKKAYFSLRRLISVASKEMGISQSDFCKEYHSEIVKMYTPKETTINVTELYKQLEDEYEITNSTIESITNVFDSFSYRGKSRPDIYEDRGRVYLGPHRKAITDTDMRSFTVDRRE